MRKSLIPWVIAFVVLTLGALFILWGPMPYIPLFGVVLIPYISAILLAWIGVGIFLIAKIFFGKK
jgi:hypothetical protein